MLDFILNNQWGFLTTVIVLLLSTAELGHRLGLGLHRSKDEPRRAQIAGVQGAVLGLLGLLLGFTFAMGLNRYDTRRNLVLKEANAIGTTWLRAGLLPEAHRAPAKDLLRRYSEVRLKYSSLAPDAPGMGEGLRASAEIQNQLWRHAEAAATEAPTDITATFVTALNEMIDTGAERVTATRNRIPSEVWVLLMMVGGAGCFITSYNSGAHGVRSLFTNLFLPLLIAVVIMLIFDLMHSQQGFIGVSQQPLIDLLNSIQPEPAP